MLQRTLPAGFVAPCLPTKTSTPPSGVLWLHEIKHDGFRIIARKAVLCAALVLLSLPTQAETPALWIELGARVHGAFGAFIPIGIRIGLDAKERIKADRRGLTVTYYTGEKAPCPCIADGVMLATDASPGQGTLLIAPEKAPAGVLAVVVVRNRKTGEGFRYTVSDTWLPKVIEWNKTLDPAGRFDAAMKADWLFEIASVPASK